MIFFRNGDASLVYYKKRGVFEVYITRCGESGREQFGSLAELVKCMTEVYDFCDEQVFELISGAEVEQDK